MRDCYEIDGSEKNWGRKKKSLMMYTDCIDIGGPKSWETQRIKD